jgi:hypothetical protein
MWISLAERLSFSIRSQKVSEIPLPCRLGIGMTTVSGRGEFLLDSQSLLSTTYVAKILQSW